MRIGFDAKRAFFNRSGLGNYSRTLITQLCALFPENEYILFSPRKPILPNHFPPENSRIVYPLKFPSKEFSSVWRSAFMGKEIDRQGIRLFHGLSNELPMDIRKSGARSVVTIHDLIFMRFPKLYKPADRMIYENKFRRSCRLADSIVAISEQTKADIVDFFGIHPEKIQVIYQGCSPLYYEKMGENSKNKIRDKYFLPGNYILYLGTIEERKNLLQLLKAKYEYKIDIPLVVVGRPTSYFEKVREYISVNKIKDVFFLKNLDEHDLPGIYHMADLFVYPSSFEGFGIPILEALNSGVPVITGSGGCMQETGGAHTLYVDPTKPGEIAESINKVLNDSELRNRMVEKGYKHAKLFREVHTAHEMMKLYQKLL